MRSVLLFPLGLSLTLLLGGCGPASSTPRAGTTEAARTTPAAKHPIAIRPGPATPVVLAAATGPDGKPVAVGCATCHATRPPNRAANASENLREFHRGLTFKHGNLTCLSCHNAANYDTLRLADGAPLEYPQALRLCAQCHGPQYRDYLHGTHGGMNGYWDLRRGPRTRNTCVDCHDPHAPLYPQVRPVFAPRDRGVRPPPGHASTH